MVQRFEDFVSTISSIHKSIQKIKKNEMKEFGLSGNHVMCLFYLTRYREGLTAVQLCKMISEDKAAVSRALGELQERGYIAYPQQNGTKKYRAAAVLTEKGAAVTENFGTIICNIVQRIGGEVSDADREGMYRSLEVIAKNLDTLAKE